MEVFSWKGGETASQYLSHPPFFAVIYSTTAVKLAGWDKGLRFVDLGFILSIYYRSN
jgi:hypothetical protein